MGACLGLSTKCTGSPISGCEATTKNDHMMRWKACSQRCIASNCSHGKTLLLRCLLGKETYGQNMVVDDGAASWMDEASRGAGIRGVSVSIVSDRNLAVYRKVLGGLQ